VKNLITDRDLLSGAVGRRIVLDGNTLITPAARDRAARIGLEIVEQGGTAAGWHAVAPAVAATCSRCGSAACTCAGTGLQVVARAGHAATLGGLPDGLYLVRVVSGRAQLLPATGPGLMVRAAGGG
jgi:hypothetical protein